MTMLHRSPSYSYCRTSTDSIMSSSGGNPNRLGPECTSQKTVEVSDSVISSTLSGPGLSMHLHETAELATSTEITHSKGEGASASNWSTDPNWAQSRESGQTEGLVGVAAVNARQISLKDNASYTDIRARCLLEKALFEDETFSACDAALVGAGSSLKSWRLEEAPVKWFRPHEICQHPRLFVDSHDRFDVVQGEIGNSWLLSSLASLADNKECFAKVVPDGQGFQDNYAGVFVFKFWKFDRWEEVVIDDRLPTRDGKLIFLRSREEEEFWSALVEKAYAKWKGSYHALSVGSASEAAVDFTGGLPERIDLARAKMTPERIFHMLLEGHAKGSFMSSTITDTPLIKEAESKGLQGPHAYAITSVVELRSEGVEQGIPLLRLRNPYGNDKEWQGDWCDWDGKWKKIPMSKKKELKLKFEDDGEFYIAFRDFLRYFGSVEICHLRPTTDDDGAKSTEKWFSGRWKEDSNGGSGMEGFARYAGNPQFFLDFEDPDPFDDDDLCPVVISLAQKQEEGGKNNFIGFKIFRVPDEHTDKERLDLQFFKRNSAYDRSGSFLDFREVSKRFLLPEGRYCVVPSTYKAGQEGEFLLRVLEDKDWSSVKKVPKKVGGDGEEEVTIIREDVVRLTLTRKQVVKGSLSLADVYKWDLSGGTEREKQLLEMMFKQLKADK